MIPHMLVMALDVGTSSTRALCFDAAGRPVPGAEARVPYDAITTPDGGVELDPAALLEAVAAAIDGCVSGAGRRGAEIQAVGASVFWHSMIALDGDGAPLTGVITWADTRSAGAALALKGALDERQIHARTGAPLHPAFFPAKLRWLRESEPALFRRARTWCGFAEYLAARLTGRLAVSVSMASGTGLLDQRAIGWDPGLLEACEIQAGQLPPIDDAPAAGLVPAMASRWPALARARWYPGRGDGACSNLGSDCSGPDRIALNIGTSAALRLVAPDEKVGGGAAPPGLWRYRVDARTSLIGGATSEGGNVLAWCRRVLALPDGDEALERTLDLIPPGSHGLTALPFLAGERSLGWRADARATLAGLSLDTSSAAIARALMEAVACRLALVYHRLAPLAAPGHLVVASGGALGHSRLWASIVTDALGVPVAMSSAGEASARGAALAALAAEGAAAPPALPVGPPLAPDLERHAIYRAVAERQGRLYDNIGRTPSILRE
jgi:gluconokinase